MKTLERQSPARQRQLLRIEDSTQKIHGPVPGAHKCPVSAGGGIINCRLCGYYLGSKGWGRGERGELGGGSCSPQTWDRPTNLNMVGVVTPDAILSFRHRRQCTNSPSRLTTATPSLRGRIVLYFYILNLAPLRKGVKNKQWRNYWIFFFFFF